MILAVVDRMLVRCYRILTGMKKYSRNVNRILGINKILIDVIRYH
jgi:hypothetical protein